MTASLLTLRPAVDARPPADPWPGPYLLSPPTAANQPTLQLVDEDEPSVSDQPAAGRLPLSVDVVPAGVGRRLAVELDEQARTWAPWFAQLLAEALDGRRPLESLGRWLDEWVLAEVSRRVRLQRRARPRSSSVPPLPPAVVASLRTQFPHPRVLEVAAHVRRGRRSAAWAFRLVRTGDRWRCTALVVGPLIEATRASAG